MKIVDVHGHLLSKLGYFSGNGQRFATAEELVAIMDRCGIAATVVMPLTAPECLATPQSNEEVIDACRRFPDRLIPFCNVDPRLMRSASSGRWRRRPGRSVDPRLVWPEKDTPGYDFKSVLAYYKSLGCRGMGEWIAPLYWDDPRTGHLLAACEEVGFPVTFHMTPMTRGESGGYGILTGKDLCDFERALKKFPSLPFIAHAFAFWGRTMRPGGCAESLLRRNANLYADLSAGAYDSITRNRRQGCRFLEEFQSHLLFGTDFFLAGADAPETARRLPHACNMPGAATPPVLRLLNYMNAVRQSGELSQTAYEKIMGQNAERLLKLNGNVATR